MAFLKTTKQGILHNDVMKVDVMKRLKKHVNFGSSQTKVNDTTFQAVGRASFFKFAMFLFIPPSLLFTACVCPNVLNYKKASVILPYAYHSEFHTIIY